MATFIEDLWNSIFTPGPTSTLLLATNVSFGALQLVLLGLLIATYSIHFLVLSFLCGGLWWAINWFAAELQIAQAQEEEAKRKGETGMSSSGLSEGTADETAGSAMDTGDDTELEGDELSRTARPSTIPGTPISAEALQGSTSSLRAEEQTPTKAGWSTGAAARLAPAGAEPVKQRKNLTESTSSISTDSEWEKVEGES